MTREQARQIALVEIKKEIEKHGIDSIAAMAPMPGKNTWTWREELEAIIKDKPLENTNENFIDGILRLEQWEKEKNQNSLLENKNYKSIKEETLDIDRLIKEIYNVFDENKIK